MEQRKSIWGDDPRLRNLVLGAVGVLIVLRLVTLQMAVEEYWRPVARLFGLHVAPAADPAMANAKLKGNLAQFFGPDSYPDDARDRGQEGAVRTDLHVDPAGFVSDCTIIASSNVPSLDRATCEIAMKHVRFEPARGSDGAPIESTYRLAVRWVLPDE